MNKEIIENIRKKLVGDKNVDVSYLQTELKFYKSIQNEEVVYAISLMLFEYLSPEIKKKFDLQVHEMLKKHQEDYNRANKYLNEGKLEESKTILDGLLAMYNQVNRLNDRKFFDFSQSIEYFLYCETTEKMRSLKIKRIPEPVTYYCYQLATISLEQHKLDEAIHYLERALLFNPCCQYIMQELIDRYQSANRLVEMFALLKKSLLYSYTKQQLAFCYRKLGWYFQQDQKYKLAIASYTISDHYQVDDHNKQNVKEILDQQGLIKFENSQQILELFKSEDLNYGPSPLVMTMFAQFVKYAEELKDLNTVKYLLTIAWELTDLPYFKEQLEKYQKTTTERNDR